MCINNARLNEVLEFNTEEHNTLNQEGIDGYISFWPRININDGKPLETGEPTFLQSLVKSGRIRDNLVSLNMSTPGEEHIYIGDHNETIFNIAQNGKVPLFNKWFSLARYTNANYERGTKLISYDLYKMGLRFKPEELK